MIERILPSGAAAAEEFGVLAPAATQRLEPAPAGWPLQRREEFAAVRTLARRALAQLGESPGPIPRGDRGAPVWPVGVVGSMTHCSGYRAAVVARASEVLTVGLDAEPHRPLPAGVLTEISLPAELEQLQRLATQRPDLCWDRLLFCTKEAVYKAWFPLTRGWLGFDQARVTLNADGTLAADLLVHDPAAAGCPVDRFSGRWLLDRDLLVAQVALTP